MWLAYQGYIRINLTCENKKWILSNMHCTNSEEMLVFVTENAPLHKINIIIWS